MSSLSARQRRNRNRMSDRTFFMILTGASVLVIALVVLSMWAANRPPSAPANAVAAPPAIADAELLPLAEPVNPISGFHDMPNMPQAGDERPRSVADGDQRARVDLPIARWDWGAIPAKPPVQQTFPIQNTGDESLIITSVVTSCGCTVADLSSSVIPPGQRADVVATFDPDFHETSGPVTRLVWLKTNDPEMPLIELRMDANVVQ